MTFMIPRRLFCFVFSFVAFGLCALPGGCVVAAPAATATPTPLIVAHRGASAEAPENTLPAFDLAWRQNADAIEGDFYLTADNKIVCIHDSTTKRTTEANLKVKDTTLAKLQTLDAGSWSNKRFANTKIPTLEQVIKTVPAGKKIYIEIKCGPEVIPFLLPQLKASKLKPEQIVLIAFDANVVEQFKLRTDRYKAYWLKSFKADRAEPSAESILETLEKIGADGLSSNVHISTGLVKTLQARGYEHHIWTVDDAPTADRFTKLKTRSITTNTPGKIKTHLATTPN